MRKHFHVYILYLYISELPETEIITPFTKFITKQVLAACMFGTYK